MPEALRLPLPAATGETESEARSELSLLAPQPHLRARYPRLAMISDRGQIARIERDDATLVVTNDWLAWREISEAGGHGIHYEAVLGDWPDSQYCDSHEAGSARWVEQDGRDITLFEGVSLGRQFTTHVSRFRHAYQRLALALERACERFRPEVIDFHDLRVEYDILDADIVSALVQEIAKSQGITFVDRSVSDRSVPVTFPVGPFARRPAPPNWAKRILLGLYASAVDGVFRVRSVFARTRPRVYVMHNWLTVDNLLRYFEPGAITPLLLIEPWPKRLGFLVRCWRKGVLLARLPEAQLDAREEADLKVMEDRLVANLSRSRAAIDRALALFVTRYFVGSGWLRERAREVKRYRKLLSRWHVERLLLGDAENMVGRLLIEAGHRLGIAADELPNGLFTTVHRSDIRNGPSQDRPSIARLLLWGRHLDTWASISAPRVPRVITGYPSLDRLRETTRAFRRQRQQKSALVLPLTVQRHNFCGLYAETFAALVETVRMLQDLGYATIRVKLHPGMTATADCYRQILRHYGLGCKVLTSGSVQELAPTADIVVGPVNSNALVETLAAGVPYYPMRGTPGSFRSEFFGGTKVYRTAGELGEALRRGEIPSRDKNLQWFCSTHDIPNASSEVWHAVQRCRSQRLHAH